jgi:hypothetical protein
MRVTKCAECGEEFSSRSVKLICPHCGTAHLRDSSRYGDSSKPLVWTPPTPILELTVAERETIHRVLDKLAREPLSFCDYLFFGFGMRWVADSLRSHELATAPGHDMFAGYTLTSAGLAMLEQLNCKFGMPSSY